MTKMPDELDAQIVEMSNSIISTRDFNKELGDIFAKECTNRHDKPMLFVCMEDEQGKREGAVVDFQGDDLEFWKEDTNRTDALRAIGHQMAVEKRRPVAVFMATTDFIPKVNKEMFVLSGLTIDGRCNSIAADQIKPSSENNVLIHKARKGGARALNTETLKSFFDGFLSAFSVTPVDMPIVGTLDSSIVTSPRIEQLKKEIRALMGHTKVIKETN